MSVLLSSIKTLGLGIKSIFSNKASFIVEKDSTIHVQFNPENFKITKSANYNYTAQKENETSYVEFSGTVVPQLEISFFFDTSGVTEASGIGTKVEADVTVLTNKFANLIKLKPNLHRPPIVTFVWGSTFFPGFVKQVSTTYIMFNKNGMPIRAKVDAVMVGIAEKVTQKIPLESPDRTKNRIVSDETSIWGIAGAEYDDVSKWRIIAKANGIMDPFDIPNGINLKVPALKE